MSTFRQRALDEAASHKEGRYFVEDRPVSEYFAMNVFDLVKMRNYMSQTAYKAIIKAIEDGKKIDRAIADEIAHAMMQWAISRGATHYTHLFQPLTGSTAEKHESFVSIKDGIVLERFSGSALVQQEPDASSFPNGGLRNTFEARGYSAWDPSSPVFILDGTLCIPSVFISYTGEALDMKLPHLRSLDALSKAATEVVNLLDPNVEAVNVNLGLEQEFFLVDESLYNARPDLKLCQRTVLGHTSAKDQQLSDHYFGAIPARVMAYMKDLETEAFKLGIQLETRHNEVAPNQFECVPAFCEATKAVDQNMLLMIIMNKVAQKHHLKVILHEKPFDGINGSGKHCNWSMQTNTGVNILSPGKSPMKNLLFLAFYSSVARAVHKHHYLLMSSVCTHSNSYRLGGHEAPPAIMSIFSGSTLTKIFESIINMEDINDEQKDLASIQVLKSIPEIFPDNTDRNRTSPFAFTGNRFEYRALGSSINPAATTFILNSIVAESLSDFKNMVDNLVSKGEELSKAILSVVREFLIESKNVLFDGNGYSKEWQIESERLGLKSVNNIPLSYEAYTSEESLAMFRRFGVLSYEEAFARKMVLNETFVKKMQIEARVLGDLCRNHIIPSAIRYSNILLDSISKSKELFGEDYMEYSSVYIETYKKINGYISELSNLLKDLIEERKKANKIDDLSTKALVYADKISDIMGKARKLSDRIEMLIDDELWPLPKYRELLFF